MTVIRYLGDTLKNLVANLGTGRDKAAASYYADPCLTDDALINAYRFAWLPRKIVDIPADDACREWRGWQADRESIEKLEAEETRLSVRGKIHEAQIKARLFGGAAVFIGTGERDTSQPLNPERIGKGGIQYLTVLNRRILSPVELETDPVSPFYGLPKMYQVGRAGGMAYIHPSRLVRFVGNPHPDPEMQGGVEHGWGDSVLAAVFDAAKNADGSAANIASLLFEAKVDVVRIPGLMEGLSDPDYERRVLERVRLAATGKGINGTLLLDKEEEYQQKSASFASLSDILTNFLQIASGAADIPLTRFLGQSPGGLNASGESDLRNYYDKIGAMQTLTIGPAMASLDECLIRSALGSRDPSINYTWNSLWQATASERADNGKKTAETIKTLAETGLIPDQALSQAAVTMLVESGVMPGLEAAVEEFGAEIPDDSDDGQAAALTDAAPRSLYVRRDVQNSDEIRAWAESQGLSDLRDDLHVTIIYSRSAFDWIKAGNARDWAEQGRDTMIIPEGGPRAVEPLGGMSAVLLFASSPLCWRHEEIVRAGASHDFADYTPHISLTKTTADLSKVEPYRGRIVLGPEVFEEIKED